MINKNPDPSKASANSRGSRVSVDIDQLIEKFASECREGVNPSISWYVENHPEHEEDIRELFPSIQWMEQLKDVEQGERNQIASQTSKHPDCIEDYQIVREIGRGGMGIVYEAFQKTLQRRVALKLLHDNAIPSAKRVARFAREARSAAGLHHSNIVPVFGFGQFEETHYYAMQFIDGVTIEDVVAALRLTLANDENAASISLKGIADSSSGSAESSAISHANALRVGQYNRRRRIENESESSRVISNDTRVPSQSPTINLNRGDSTVVGDPEDLEPGQSRGDDTFDLFQMTAEQTGVESRGFEVTDSNDSSETFEAVADKNLNLGSLGRPYWTSIARLGFQVADALNYAHNCKVVHRDIKPSNLLLDSKGVVWVADFGLAKPFEHDDLTRTGDTVGTLRYMAPEQVAGKVDHRSDIYSLGLSLYELATLEQAFGQQNHAQLFKNKTSGALTAPRKLNPHIPRDLETIILKATATDPESRYATAGKMAADLQLFLEDRPIQSRRANSVERLWRWSRRNPAVASLTALAMFLLLAVAVISTVSNFRTNAALTEANTAKTKLQKQTETLEDQKELLVKQKEEIKKSLKETTAAQWQAESYLMLAMDAFEEIRDNLSSRGMPVSYEFEFGGSKAPRTTATLTPDDADLLNSLIRFYEDFAAQDSGRPEIQLKIAEAQHHLGMIYTRLSEFELAESSLKKALDSYRAKSREDETNLEYKLKVAQVLNDLCVMSNEDANVAQSMLYFREAKMLLAREAKDSPDSLEIQYQLGLTLDLLGQMMIRNGSTEIGLELNKQPKDDRSNFGNSPLAERIRKKMNPTEAVRAELDRAAGIFRRLVETDPFDHRFLIALTETQRHQLVFAMLNNDFDSASKHFESAIDNLGLLSDSFKNNPQFKFDLADTLSLADTRLKSIVDNDDARKKIARAMGICRQLIERFPNVSQYQLLEANCHRKMALIDSAEGKIDDANRAFDAATAQIEKLAEKHPEIQAYQIHLTLNKKQKADSLLEYGRKTDDAATVREARSQVNRIIRDFTVYSRSNENPFNSRVMSSLYHSLALAHLELGFFEECAQAEAIAQELSDRPWGWGGSRRYFGRFRRPPSPDFRGGKSR